MRRSPLRWSAIGVSYRARVTVMFVVSAAFVSVAFGMLAYAGSRTYLTGQRETAGRDRAYLNARLVRDHLRARPADPGEVFTALAPEEGATALLRVDGRWFSSSVAIAADDLPRDVLEEIERGAAAWQRHRIRGRPHLAVAVPIAAVDAVYAEVIPLRQLDAALTTMRTSLVAAGAVTTAGGGVIGFLLAGRLVRPLRKLTERAEAIAAGDAGALEPAAVAELQPLVASLNRVIEGYTQRAEQGSRFASDVSHEVRAPLAALSAAISVMQRRRSQLPVRSAHALDLLSDQIEDFNQLVLDLLEISRIDAGGVELRREPTDPAELARAAAASIDLGDLPVIVDDEVPGSVLLDRRRMAQALINLLDNARRYAGGPTRVTISRRADVLAFSVHDAGPGVPEDERERIFARFERGEYGGRGPHGTGLGLALVVEHARLHGGRAFVRDVDGGGAEFVVEVELCEPV